MKILTPKKRSTKITYVAVTIIVISPLIATLFAGGNVNTDYESWFRFWMGVGILHFLVGQVVGAIEENRKENNLHE